MRTTTPRSGWCGGERHDCGPTEPTQAYWPLIAANTTDKGQAVTKGAQAWLNRNLTSGHSAETIRGMRKRWGYWVGALALFGLALTVLVLERRADTDPDAVMDTTSGPVRDGDYPVTPPAFGAQQGSSVVVSGAPQPGVTIHDGQSGETVAELDLPFEDAIVYPDTVPIGDGIYAIAGVPCADAVMNDAGVDCEPGGVSVAFLNAAEKTIEPIDVTGLEGQTPYVNLVGSYGSDLMLQLGGRLFSLSLDGGALKELPGAPLDSLRLACMDADGRLTAIEQKYGVGDTSPAPGELVEVPNEAFAPFAAAVFDPLSGGWTDVGSPSGRYDTTDTFEFGCVDSGVIAVPSEKPLSDAPYVTYLLDSRSGMWSEAPPPPIEFLSAAPPGSDGSQVVLSVSSDLENRATALLSFDASTASWTSTPGGLGSLALGLAVVDDQAVSLADSGAVRSTDIQG